MSVTKAKPKPRKKMSFAQFLTELRKHRGTFHVGRADGSIRCEKGDCPIVAVAVRHKVKVRRDGGLCEPELNCSSCDDLRDLAPSRPRNDDWRAAGLELGINKTLAGKIVRAADAWRPRNETRKALLKALGLKEIKRPTGY
jgi:hypothetical protein